MNTADFFADILPRVEDFGRYALAIQNIAYRMSKDSPNNPSKSALTDTDFIVQEGLSRHFLEKGYRFELFAEEISPYTEKFPNESEIKVTLDPIDGTFAYMLGYPNFCEVVAVYKKGFLDGAMVHTPFDKKTYCATHDIERSWVWTSNESGHSTEDFNIEEVSSSKPEANILMTWRLPENQEQELQQKGFTAYQFDKKDRLSPEFGLNSILRGEIAAYFKRDVPCIDCGPISLIVDKGGGVVTDYNGRTEGIYQYWNRSDGHRDSRIPSIIVAGTPEVHEILVDLLRDR